MRAGFAVSRLGIAMVASAGLVFGLVVPAEAVAVEDPMFEPSLVAPVESPPVAVVPSVIPAGDFSSLSGETDSSSGGAGYFTEASIGVTRQFGSLDKAGPVEALDLDDAEVVERSEFETVYANPAGGGTLVSSLTPVNAEDASGEWVPIDTHLSRETDGSWSTDVHPLDPSFAADAADDELFAVSRYGYDVSFSLVGAADSPIERGYVPPRTVSDGDDFSYEEVFDGVDLEFEVESGWVKEALVLSELPARSEASWTWRIDSDGLRVRFDELGNVEFVNAGGVSIFYIPAPVMWDSSGVAGVSEDALANVDTELTETSSGWELTLRPDYGWLSDPERVFPVSVDPTTVSGEANRKAFKQDGAWRTDATFVGNATAGQWKNWRTVIVYPYSGVSGYQVTNAYLRITHGNQGYLGAASGGIYTASGYCFNCVSEYLAGTSVAVGTYYYGGGQMAVRYAQMVRDGNFGTGLILTGQEGTAYTNQQWTTDLRIDYKSYPSVTGYAAPSPANGAVHVATMPILAASGSQPDGYQMQYAYRIGTTSNVEASQVYSSEAYWTPWGQSSAFQVPQSANLLPGTTYYWRGCVRDATEGTAGISTVRCGAVQSFTTNAPAPIATQTSTAPANGSVVTTLTPTLTSNTVTDADGDPVQYGFRIATGADGKTGTIIDSGWQPTPSWTVPAGVLQDGGSYTWVALTSDGIDTKISPSWTNKLQVNLRLGTSGPSPYDSAGPVTVNLANGNASLGFASPTVGTLGGPMGLSFSYNSQSIDATRGLTGSYYDALNVGQSSTATFDFTGRIPVLVRTDPQVSFQWATGSPGPAIPSDYFLSRWTGFVTVPAAGSYTFGVVRDDGARVVLNDTNTVIDQWTTATVPLTWGTPVTMMTTPTAIRVDAYDSTAGAGVELWVKGPGLPAGGQIVPANWFSTKVQPLPAGWTSSTPIAGAASAYASAKVTESSVVLTDMSGTAHTYVKTSTGGYTAPVGEYGILSLDTTGQIMLTEADGTVYAFTGQGAVASVTTASDALKPATPILTYRANGLVDRVSDPVSLNVGSNPATYSREVRFIYQGDPECVTPSGYTAPAALMLCRIIYPGTVTTSPDNTTRLGYNPNGQLTAVIDPGVEQTTFGYDGNGRLAWVRDSLANDWLAATSTSPTNMNSTTEISYTGGRVASVTLPAPDGLTAAQRPAKTFTYQTATLTYVDVAGLNTSGATATAGHAAAVTFDAAWRQLTATSPMGLTSSRTWSVKDQVLSATDAQGLTSTTIYNAQDRPTDTYGPAPTACYGTDRRPLSSCPIVPAHTATAYDAGLNGLHVAWYANTNLSGRPTTFSLGLPGVTDGSVNKDWGTGAPITGITATDNWSAQLTGLITFPTAGTWKVETYADDGTRLYLDDQLKVDDLVGGAPHWPTTAGTITTTTPNEVRRIRIQYREASSGALLQLHWSVGGGARTLVPGSALKPDYGLANGVTVDDAAPAGSGLSDTQVPDLVTSLGYTHPWLGAVTSSTIDPGGLNLTTTTAYEAPSSGANSWLRRLTRTMPSGTPATTTSTYYTDTATLASATCGVPAGTKQYGFTKTTTTPTPSSGSGIVTEYVYDLFGRTAGTKRSGDATWSCVTYDARGRATQSVFSAYGTVAARTVTNNFAVGSNPLVSSVTDPVGTITSTIDLLGRAVTSTDVWGTVTTPSFEALTGRVLSVTTSPPLSSDADIVQSYTYDLDGKVETISVDGDVIADPTYASTQLLQSIAYVNGTTLSGLTRNQAGAGTGMTWSFPGSSVEHPAEVALNSTFEGDDSGWEAATGSTIEVGTTGAHGGTGTLLSARDSATGYAMVQRVVNGLQVGATYTVSGWVNSFSVTSGTDVHLGVNNLGYSTGFTPTGVWQQVSYQFTATSTSHQLKLRFHSSAPGEQLAWDDVALTRDAWVETITPASSVSDAVVRSQSGRIIQNTLTDTNSPVAEVSTYSFDAAGRLATAVIPRHTLAYGYGVTGCGNPAAGKNGNRTTFSDTFDGGTPTTVAYCYDNADRLTSTAVTNAPVGASPVAGGNLTTTGPGASLAYDAHGNTTRLADQTLFYDVADRHYKTVLDDGTTITYTLDAGGRMVARTVAGSPPMSENGTIRYLAGGAIADASNAVQQWVVSLPGGVTLTLDLGATSGAGDDSQRWGYPNMHGDVIVTADGAGTRVGARAIYDPFGQSIDPTTWKIGTTTADDAVPDLVDGDADFGWVGQHSKYTEHPGSIATIEMGARQYVPTLGRFLEGDC